MLDTQHLIDSILKAVQQGVDDSLEQVKARAQERAPVRKLFKGGKKVPFRGRIGVRNSSVDITRGSAYFYKSHFGQGLGQPPAGLATSRHSIFAADIASAAGKKRQGRVNSTYPTFRAGHMRLASTPEADLREMRNGQFRWQRVLLARVVDLNQFYLGRALSDIARGRGVHTPPAGGVTEYGGTLRDSIRVIPATRRGSEVRGYVEAHATDPGRDFDYAKAQEFGTAHNRAQPYLRPALRELHSQFLKQATESLRSSYSAFGRGFARASSIGSTKLVTTIGLHVKIVGVNQAEQRVNAALRRAGIV